MHGLGQRCKPEEAQRVNTNVKGSAGHSAQIGYSSGLGWSTRCLPVDAGIAYPTSGHPGLEAGPHGKRVQGPTRTGSPSNCSVIVLVLRMNSMVVDMPAPADLPGRRPTNIQG